MITQALRVWRGTTLRGLVWLVAMSAAAIACDGTEGVTEPNVPIVPDPKLPASVQPAEIIKVVGDNQEGRPGDQLYPLIVAVRDAAGKPVAGARVRFSVTAGDGYAALILTSAGGNQFVARYRGPADQVTDAKGEALVLWFLGRHGENTLLATVEGAPQPLAATFRATSVSSGYTGGSFALTSNGTPIKLSDYFAQPYDCVVKSGSLVLSADGSFEAQGDFKCEVPGFEGFSFNVIETGFYSILNSTIVLHYLNSNDTAGFFWDRDVYGFVSESTVAFKSHGVEWRYAILANAAGP